MNRLASVSGIGSTTVTAGAVAVAVCGTLVSPCVQLRVTLFCRVSPASVTGSLLART